MNTLLLWLAGLLILVLGALFAGPYFVDWNSYRTAFEAQATRLVGRPVTVEGNVNLRLLPAPYVSFERVQIAGRPAAPEKSLLQIENYTLWLAVPPLLQGEIVAQAMEIDRPTLDLRLTRDGTFDIADLARNDVTLPFVPRNVAFRNVQITGGSLSVHTADDRLAVRQENISGTLTALALTGPYKFDGTVGDGAQTREMRWSTGRMTAEGAVRVKGQWRAPNAGMTVAIDGQLLSALERPAFSGSLAGRRRLKETTGFEFKGDVFADTSGGSLKDMTLLLDAEGRPQIIEGSGTASWEPDTEPQAALTLTSRWLDVDRLISSGEKTGMLSRITTALEQVETYASSTFATKTTFKASQVNFNGAPLDGIELVITRNGETARVEKLQAALPGAAHLNMSGVYKASPPTASGTAEGRLTNFAGRLRVEGRALARFAAWLEPSWTNSFAQTAGNFSLSGDLALAPGSLALTNGRGYLDKTVADIGVRYRESPEEKLSIALDAVHLDLAKSWGALSETSEFLRRWAQSGRQAGDAVAAGDADTIAVSLTGTAAQITLADAVMNDVAVSAELNEDGVAVDQFTLITQAGLSIDAKRGRVDPSLPDAERPLRFLIEVGEEKAMAQMLSLAGVSLEPAMLQRINTIALPARLAGQIARDGSAQTVTMRYDGTLAGNPAIGRVQIAGEEADLQTRTWTVVSDIVLKDPAPILEAAGLPAIGVASGPGEASAQSNAQADDTATRDDGNRLVVYALGRPRDGLKTDLSLNTPNVTVRFAGPVSTSAPSADAEGERSGGLPLLRASGKLSARVKAGNQLAELIATPSKTPNGENLHVAATLEYTPGKTRLSNVRWTYGAENGEGTLAIERTNGASRVTLNAEASTLALPQLARILSGTTQSSPGETGDVVWPATPFTFHLPERMTVDAALKVRQLAVTETATLSNAALTAFATGARAQLDLTSAAFAGGRVSGSARLDRRAAGAALKAQLRAENLALAELSGTSGSRGDRRPATARSDQTSETRVGIDNPPIAGRADLALDLEGVALTPKGLVSVARGTGQLLVRGGTLRDFSPQAVQDVAADLAEDNASVNQAAVKARLASRLDDRPLAAEELNLALAVRDGAIEIAPFRITTGASAISAKSFVDLARLRLDSEWRIKPTVAVAAAQTSAVLPAISIFYAGPMYRPSEVKRGFGVAALERELTVRRLEGNIDQLEGTRALIRKRVDEADEAGADADARERPPRPTIESTAATQGRKPIVEKIPQPVRPAPPKPQQPRRQRRSVPSDDGLWGLDGTKPPVDLRLQTPQGANPT
ncbi:MAG: AsmA family protein [Pseudomonadota bacterium]